MKEDRVHHLPSPDGEAKGDIRDAKHGWTGGQGLLDQTQTLDGLHRTTDIPNVSTSRREDQRIEDDIGLRDAVILAEQLVAAAGDLELALAGECLRLLRVLVDHTHDHSGAVAAQQRGDSREAILAILEVDRVDDGLALTVGERDLNRLGIGGVDHQRCLDRPAEAFVKLPHGNDLDAFGSLKTDIHNVGAALDLPAGDLDRLVPLFGGHKLAEFLRADDVGPFTHQEWPIVVVQLHQLDAAITRTRRAPPWDWPWPTALSHTSDGRDMVGVRAATTADNIEPLMIDKTFERSGETFRRLCVAAVLVWQTGVGETADRTRRALLH